MENTSRVVKLTQDLIAINSENPPGREQEVAAFLKEYLEPHGISVKAIGSNKRPNLVCSTIDDELGPIVFHGHMDTVPTGAIDSWHYAPLSGTISDGKLYGRGSCDMKGPVAALVDAMLQYSESKHEMPFVLLCTSDEESGCSGAEAVADNGILEGVKYGVCAEPTDLNVLVGEKGMFWSKVIAKGKAAHGSRPDEGLNAIRLCHLAIDAITSFDYSFEPNDLLGNMTINVGMIQGGIKINVVPDYCEASIDMRTVQGQSTELVMQEMKKALGHANLSANVSIEYIHGKSAVITPKDSPIVSITLDAVESITGDRIPLTSATYGTDCSVLQPRIGIQNVICGPGSIEQAHQPNEFISISQLEQAVRVYLRIADHIDNFVNNEKD